MPRPDKDVGVDSARSEAVPQAAMAWQAVGQGDTTAGRAMVAAMAAMVTVAGMVKMAGMVGADHADR